MSLRAYAHICIFIYIYIYMYLLAYVMLCILPYAVHFSPGIQMTKKKKCGKIEGGPDSPALCWVEAHQAKRSAACFG